MRPFVTVPALLCMLVFSTVGHTQTTQGDAERGAARDAGYEGIAAYQKGDLVVAVDKLGRAFDVAKVPTLGLWYARALAKTGKLVEASERYGEVTRLEVSGGKVKEQKQAQADAADELAALRPKIPSLTWTVVGATGGFEVTVNGSPVPSKLMGLPTPMNPGTYRIRANQQAQVAEQSVTIAESEKKAVQLKFEGSTDSTAKDQANGQTNAKTVEQSKSLEAPAAKPSRTGAYVGVAVTGVFAVAATVTGLLTRSKQNAFDDAKARDDRAAAQSASDSGKTLALITDISIGAAVVSAGVTTYLLLTSSAKPSEKVASSQSPLQLAPMVGRSTWGMGLLSSF